MLLILTSDQDLTADYLIIELMRRGLPYFRLNSEELSEAEFTFSLDGSGTARSISVGPRSLDLGAVEAVWYRRAVHPIPKVPLSPAERHFVSGEIRHLVTGLVLNPRVKWVNPIDKVSIAEHKLYQLQVAAKLGFRIPRTLVSNDVEKLKAFALENPNGTICKPIYHGLFFDGTSNHSIYTRRFDVDTLDADSVKACPVLLQEEIPRIGDVRVTFIGRHCFVADVRGNPSLVDWRDPGMAVDFSVSAIDDKTTTLCRNLLMDLGLAYGAFDFVRTPSDELVFLEVNPTGEWAWLENRLGFPMRDAFVETFFGDRQ